MAAPAERAPGWLCALSRRLGRAGVPLAQLAEGALRPAPGKQFQWTGAQLAPADWAALQKLQLDFLLNFTPRFDMAALAGLAVHGVWTYQLGRWHTHFPTAPCFGEMLRGERVVDVGLTATLAPGRPPAVLHAGKIPLAWNYPRTLTAVLAASADWVARVCQEILYTGAAGAQPAAEADAAEAPLSQAPEEKAQPTHRQCLRCLWRQASAGWQALVDDLFYYDIWNVGFVQRPPDTGAALQRGAALPQLRNIAWLPPRPARRYLADPFSYTFQGRRYLLLEDYAYARPERGQIVRLALPAGPAGLVLEKQLAGDQHFSYPCVVTVGGDTYCIPESYAAKACRLYRLQADGTWGFARVLIDQRAVVDPTVFLYNGTWWLFFTDHAEGSNLKLFAYYATDFDGEWRPHALNPLKCDVTSARPAGPPFMLAGQLYRPAQDCSQTYGGAVTLNQVLALSPATFQEQPVGQLRPDPQSPYPAGLHHLVVEDDLLIIDAKKRVFDVFFRLRQPRPAR